MRKLYFSIFLVFALLSCAKNQEVKQFSLAEIRDLKIYDNLDSLPKNKNEVYRLDLSEKELKEIPKLVHELSNLQELNLSVNNLSDLKDIDKLEKLQILNIGMNNFNTFPNEVTKLKNLKYKSR